MGAKYYGKIFVLLISMGLTMFASLLDNLFDLIKCKGRLKLRE